MKKNDVVKKISYSIFANIISLAASTLLVVIIPKYLTISDYGYWQLYLFYVGYVGLLQFGLCDGVYLRYGGAQYVNLDKNLFAGEFKLFFVMQLFISVLFYCIIFWIPVEADKFVVMIFTSINILVLNLKFYVQYILQLSARIKEYSIIVILDKLLYTILVGFFVFAGMRHFSFILMADIIAKIITMFVGFYYCREIIYNKTKISKKNLYESHLNIKVGLSLLISNLMGSLVLGVVRFFIEGNWGIEEFGKVSFSLSISNILVIFISAISTVLFPLIRRIPESDSKNIFVTIRNSFDILVIGGLILFFPLREIILIWIPSYSISMFYLVFLIPLCVFQARTALVLTTYIKALRLEKKLALINTICGSLSFVFSIISVYVFNSIILACISMSVLFYIHTLLCEILVSSNLNVSFIKNNTILTLMLLIFCIFAIYFNWIIAAILYLFSTLIVFLIKKNECVELLNTVRKLKYSSNV